MTSPAIANGAAHVTSAAAYRVRSTRWMLGIALFLSGVLRAAAVVSSLLVVAAVVDLVVGLPLRVRESVLPLAMAAGASAFAVTLWRGRQIRSLERVALWVEERIPWLQYSLVTSLDSRHVASHRELEPIVGEAQWGGIVIREWWQAVRMPASIALLAGFVVVLLPDGAASRTVSPRAGDSVERTVIANRVDPLATLAATISPPRYSGLPDRVVDDPQTIAALTGSVITVRGRGAADSVRAMVADRRVAAGTVGNGWQVRLDMPVRPGALRLATSERDRWIVLEPRADAAPVVRLLSPLRDTVLREPAGSIALAATAADDFGLLRVSFEVIISSGQGESFSFRTMTPVHMAPGGARTSDLRLNLRMDSLQLAAGDVVHVRAVARDGNTVTGPGNGASETRSIRIARSGEYDSVAVEGAPPPEVDKSLLSQRMLIIVAERLHARRDAIPRPTLVSESRTIAADQTRLRQRVGELVFIRLEGEDTGEHAHGPGDGHEHGPDDLREMTPEQLMAAAQAATAHDGSAPLDFAEGESPIVSVNRPLLEAYNAMWQAGSELEQGSPGRALPHMRAALDALQRARAAERVYLRGRPPAVIVDVADARLKGGERGAPAAREMLPPGTDAALQLALRFDRMLELLASSPDAATDSLMLLRIDAIATAPSFAAALGEAVEALRAGRDATELVARARRAVAGDPISRASLPAWGTAW